MSEEESLGFTRETFHDSGRGQSSFLCLDQSYRKASRLMDEEKMSDVHRDHEHEGLADHVSEVLDRTRKTLSSYTSLLQSKSFNLVVQDVFVHRRLLTVQRERPMMTVLTDAEAAANSAAFQLVSFKDALEDKPADRRASAADRQHLSRQRGLLLDRLEDFRRINKTVRQKLKQLRHAESCRVETDKHLDDLMRRISLAENENQLLKSSLSETERRIEEVMDERQEEKESLKTVVDRARTVEATQSHLQTQVWNKEAENERLTLQLQTLQGTVTEQETQIRRLNDAIESLNQRAERDKEILRRASRAQRQRAERFELAIQKCSAQLRKKDVQLASVCSERDDRRKMKEQTSEEKQQIVAQVARLKREVADLTSGLQWEKDEVTAANALVKQKMEKLSAENRELGVDNATLKRSACERQQQLSDLQAALVQEKMESQERRRESEERRRQVMELQAEVQHLRDKFSRLQDDVSEAQDQKKRVEEARRDSEQRVKSLVLLPEKIRVVEQEESETHQKIRVSRKKNSGLSRSVEQQRLKMASQVRVMMSSEEMKGQVQEVNLKLQEQVSSLQGRMELLQQQNREQLKRLSAQEDEVLSKHLDQKSRDCVSLRAQLEEALLDVTRQVEKVRTEATTREDLLQVRVLELEAQKSRQEEQLTTLRSSRSSSDRRVQLQMQDLQLSLQRSESDRRSVQNFVDLLKNSFHTMT